MVINWYPGHMVKARREIEQNLSLVDIVIILLDARAPLSCRNPDLEKMVKSKKIIMVLNKNDLAAAEKTREYKKQLSGEGIAVASIDSLSGKGSREVLQTIRSSYQPVADEMIARGRRVRPARVMVVGVPNIGKSTFLNCLVGKKIVQTGASPGVTRGKQWVRIREDIEFMDTPGLMWPKIEDEEQGLKLALLDIVGEKSYNDYDVALFLIKIFSQKHPAILKEKYKLDDLNKPEPELLRDIARKRGHLLKGGELDLEKTCTMLLLDFRKGHIGPISID